MGFPNTSSKSWAKLNDLNRSSTQEEEDCVDLESKALCVDTQKRKRGRTFPQTGHRELIRVLLKKQYHKTHRFLFLAVNSEKKFIPGPGGPLSPGSPIAPSGPLGPGTPGSPGIRGQESRSAGGPGSPAIGISAV